MAKITLFLFIVIITIMIPAVTLLWQYQDRTIIEQAHMRAQTIHKMILIVRQWVAENRDRIVPVPAVATKELSKYAEAMASFRFHITSDKLVNTENAPTSFETEAMEAIRKNGVIEYARVVNDEKYGAFYNYAAPLFINEFCLNCHEDQGYLLDDFRGIISVSFSLEEFRQSFGRYNSIVFYTIIVGLLAIVIVVSLLIHWLVVRHINTLTNATLEIKQGNIVETKIETNDEIEILADAFNQMSKQIALNEDVLKTKLDDAVGKYVSLVEELKEKNKTLDSVNQLKTELLDSIAHEIRTPLTKILSYSELLSDERMLDDTDSRHKFATNMKRNINAIKNMFSDIITLSRLEHEQYEYHHIPINLSKLVKDIIEMCDIEIRMKSLSVSVNINEGDIILVDGESFSSAMQNIIGNACKYSYPNSIINISAKRVGNEYIIRCEDNGIGIPSEDLDKILIKFHRGANVKKEFTGTGLGLSIVARIIKAHNGRLDIRSVENEYTEVIITFNTNDILKESD